jgi:hypothetical protein
MRRQKLAARRSAGTRIRILLGALLAAALLLPSLALAQPRKVVVFKRKPHRTVVVVKTPVPKPVRAVTRVAAPRKKVWVRGHWKRAPLGWRIWVPGHWERVR